jgi:hypothetical protein
MQRLASTRRQVRRSDAGQSTPAPHGGGCPATLSGPRPDRRTSQATGTPIDFSRACARPARAFRPSRYVLTSVPGRFNTLHPSRQYSSICASVSRDPLASSGIRQNRRQPRARGPRVAITCRAKRSGYPSRMSQATAPPPVEGRQGIARRTGQYWTAWSPTTVNCA